VAVGALALDTKPSQIPSRPASGVAAGPADTGSQRSGKLDSRWNDQGTTPDSSAKSSTTSTARQATRLRAVPA
jgi:hypothetical protein